MCRWPLIRRLTETLTQKILMKIWKEKLLINAPIEHVYKCISDFDLFEQFVLSQKEETIEALKKRRIKKFKFQYDQALDELTVISDYPLFKIVTHKKIANKYIAGIIVPLNESINMLGEAKIECKLTKISDRTEMFTEVNSLKEPKIFARIFIKIFTVVLKFKSKSGLKKFVNFVEKCA